jgi:predicted permease
MSSILQTLRSTTRGFLRSPVFLAITVFTLATGIGATSAIFSVVNAVLLRPLPYVEPERLVGVWHTAPGLEMDQFEQSDASYLLYRKANHVLTDLGIYNEDSVTLTGGSEPERLTSANATGSLFEVLGVPPALGRSLQEADEKPGAPPVVVLSHSLWQRRFGGDKKVIGKVLRVDGVTCQVVGVMPEDFRFPEADTALWQPISIDPAKASPGNFNFKGIGRLRSGVTPEQAQKDIAPLVYRIPEEYNGKEISRGMIDDAKLSVLVHPLRNDIVGDVERILWILLGSVALILLIACANVANLFLVRAEGRQREVAVRVALGASRGAIFRSFLAESLGLGLLGGVLGLALAAAGTRLLVHLRPQGIPRLEEIGVDARVVAFTAVVALLSGLFFGLIAALRYGSPTLVPALKDGGRGGTAGKERNRARHILVVSQVALALVLLVGAGLMVKSFWQLRNVDPGFNPQGVLTLRLSLPETDYPDSRKTTRFHQQLLDKVRAIPGVEAAGTISLLPLSGGGNNSGTAFEDFPLPPGTVPPILASRYVSPGYFEAMGIPRLEGQIFDRLDTEHPEATAVVSQALAERFWPGKSALGHRLFRGLPTPGEVDRWCTIVGVVGSVHEKSLDQKPEETIYYPLLVRRPSEDDPAGVDYTPRYFALVVKSRGGEPAALTPRVRQAVRELDANVPLAEVMPMTEVLDRSTARTSFTMLLLVIAAAVALLLGAVGLYGVISYTVTQRTREIGVRMAIGANRWEIARMVLGEGMVLTVVGIVIGLAGAFSATRLMVALLYEVTPTDPPVFASVPLLLALIALFSAYLPARRAADTEPLEAIRYE